MLPLPKFYTLKTDMKMHYLALLAFAVSNFGFDAPYKYKYAN